MDIQNDTQFPFPDLSLTFVEGSSFSIGDQDVGVNGQEHEIRLSSFYIGKYPVTQRLWQAVMEDNPSFFKGEDRPVETVSWHDAQDFIKKLNSCQVGQNLLKTLGVEGSEFRLPTETEWEYAARGGTKSKGFIYSGSNQLKEVSWYFDNSDGETKPVGRKAPNELGIFDMSGNVREWCNDWYDQEYYEECVTTGTVINPLGPDTGINRVLRGGSYFSYPCYCRSTFRHYYPGEEDSYFNVGFRLLLPCQSGG